MISQALTALLRDLKTQDFDDSKNPAVLYEDSHVYGTGLNVMDLVKKTETCRKKRSLEIKSQRIPGEQWASCPSKEPFS